MKTFNLFSLTGAGSIALALLLAPVSVAQERQEASQPEQEQAATLTEVDVDRVLQDWREEPRDVARQLIEQYGPPAEVTHQRLIWHDGDWWKRTEIVNEEIPHNFPEEHTDFLYQTVNYNVPVEKVGELAELNGSIIVDRVHGELTARSNSTEHVLLLLNVADQVIDGRHTAESGRDVIAQAWLEGQHSEMLERLLFSPELAHPEPGDPGVIYGARPDDER